jgi:hypothetical protein
MGAIFDSREKAEEFKRIQSFTGLIWIESSRVE